MPDIDSPDEMARLENFEETHFPARRIQSSRAFLLLTSSSLAIIVLSIFLNLQIAPSTKMLLLFVLFALILGAVIYMDRNSSTTMLSAGDDDKHVEATVSHMDYMDTSDTESRPDMQQIEITNQEDRQQDDDAENWLPEVEQQDLTTFEQLVRSALDSIPAEFHDRMQNVIVQVEDEPRIETLKMVGTREGQTLLGLYHGVPITSLGYQHALLPQRITIYQHTIERYCGNDPARIQAQVRATVLHEVAHHFGIDHEEMPIWIRG